MAEGNIHSTGNKKKEEFEKMLMKPLPYILAEMKEDIKIALQSGTRAEETSKVAKEASEASIKTSQEMVSRAEEISKEAVDRVEASARELADIRFATYGRKRILAQQGKFTPAKLHRMM